MSVPNDGSYPEVTTCNTGGLGGKISNPANEESLKPAPVISDTFPTNPSYTIAFNDNLPAPDARSFPEIPTRSGAGSKYLSNANYQVVKQKSSKAYSAEIVNGNPPVPDVTLTSLESQLQPTQAQESQSEYEAWKSSINTFQDKIIPI
ncbi:hypothetical protein DSO57_1018319, partial [Entomophthora muscae]